MEMIAASRIVKAQRRVQQARPYAEQITEVIKGLAISGEVREHPLLRDHAEVPRVAVVVNTSDRGLAGPTTPTSCASPSARSGTRRRPVSGVDLVVRQAGIGY